MTKWVLFACGGWILLAIVDHSGVVAIVLVIVWLSVDVRRIRLRERREERARLRAERWGVTR